MIGKSTHYLNLQKKVIGWQMPFLLFIGGFSLFICSVCVAESTSEPFFEQQHHGQRIFLSLHVLAEKAINALEANEQIPEECLNLVELSYIEGYIVDKSPPGDIILFGLQSDKRATLKLDDLIVNLRAIANSPTYPYCSLDPTRESTLAMQSLFASTGQISSPTQMKELFKKLEQTVGPQTVVVGGVPFNSRHAHVMIDADYHMKKVSQGHIEVEGITSCLDHTLNEAAQMVKKGQPIPAMGMSMARFWFHVGKEAPTFQKSTDIVAIDRCDMVILTEKQKSTTAGELIDVAEDDPHAQAFAFEMSEYLSKPDTSQVLVYTDLENLFRLRALLLSMEYQRVFQSIGWSFSDYIPGYDYQDEKAMDPSMPGLAYSKEWTNEIKTASHIQQITLFPMVCGGVGMDMTVNKDDFNGELVVELKEFRLQALKSRPSEDSLYWTLEKE